MHELGVRRQQRVLLALSDGVEFVATWYGAEDRCGDRRGLHVSAAQGLRLLPELHRSRGRRRGRRHARGDARRRGRESPPAFTCSSSASRRKISSPASAASRPSSPRPRMPWSLRRRRATTSPSGSSRRQYRRTCVRAPSHSPLLSFDWHARGVLDINQDDVVLPVPKLFFGYARDLAALYPFGVGGAGVVFPERTTPERIFELIPAIARPSSSTCRP